MRGDSLRDLYAKTLALLGLGVLAGTGALVDYWPTGGGVPGVSAGIVSPALAGALAEPTDAVRVEPPAVIRAPRRVVPASPGIAQPTLQAAAFDPRMIPGQPVALGAPPRPMVPTIALAAYAGEEVALSNPELFMDPPPVTVLARAGEAPGSADGFFVGAVKKTRESIVKTSKKTGASIFDAVKMLGTAVRRALPTI